MSMMILLLVGGSIAEMIGCKRTLIIGQSGIVIGWIIMYFANHFPILIVGRIISGAGVGLSFPISTLLLSDISLIKMRGTLTIMGNLVFYIGFIYSLVIAKMVSLHTLMIMSIIPELVFLAFSWFLPESPIWLMKKGHFEKAQSSLESLRGPDYDISMELEEIKTLIESQDNTSFSQKLRYLNTRKNIIPLTIMSLMFILQVSFNLKRMFDLNKISTFSAFLWPRNYWMVLTRHFQESRS